MSEASLYGFMLTSCPALGHSSYVVAHVPFTRLLVVNAAGASISLMKSLTPSVCSVQAMIAGASVVANAMDATKRRSRHNASRACGK